jgi:hypothetical protein
MDDHEKDIFESVKLRVFCHCNTVWGRVENSTIVEFIIIVVVAT